MNIRDVYRHRYDHMQYVLVNYAIVSKFLKIKKLNRLSTTNYVRFCTIFKRSKVPKNR